MIEIFRNDNILLIATNDSFSNLDMIINCYLNAFLADFNSALFTAKFSGWIALMLACCSAISCDPDVDLSKTLALE